MSHMTDIVNVVRTKVRVGDRLSLPAAMPSPVQAIYPALYLYPLNDSFVPKHILLPQGQRIKIGRQTNAKTAPGERNGFFDSKVLSRAHAEVWEESNKVFYSRLQPIALL